MKRSKHRQPGVRKNGPAQRKLGTLQKGDRIADKFHKTDIETLICDVALGVPLAIVCRSVGITPRTFELWLDGKPEFAQKLASEKRRVILETLDGIRSCSTKEREFRHLVWFLERVYPETFAPKPPNFAIFEQNNYRLSEERSREITERAQRLLEDNSTST